MMPEMEQLQVRTSAMIDQVIAEITETEAIGAMETIVNRGDDIDWNNPILRRVNQRFVSLLLQIALFHKGNQFVAKAEEIEAEKRRLRGETPPD